VGRSTALNRLERLDQLRGILAGRDVITVRELAEEMKVSRRSVGRDLAVLRQSGVPIDADRGRGGGLRLERRWSFGRINLSLDEIIDLLVSLAVAERLDSPLFLTQLGAVRQKLSAAFAEAHRGKVQSLRRRIIVGVPASKKVLESYGRPDPAVLAAVKRAFFDVRRLVISYVDERGVVTRREVEPQFLTLNQPVWYLLAWDGLREDVRVFRTDRLRSAEILSRGFRPRDRAPFLAKLEETAAPV
jgi:predicted DNA-binding transcriptional regulator YafY